MAKKSNEPLKKHTMLLYDGDYERLQDLYPEVGASIIIRKIVRDYLNKVSPPAKVRNDVNL